MSIFTALFMFMLIWWTMLFAVLPWGIRGQAEENAVEEGSEPGAPVNPHLKRKFIQTTLWSLALWAVIVIIIQFELIDVRGYFLGS